MSRTLDWSKSLKTRNGLDVRIFEERVAKSSFPIIGTVRNAAGFDSVHQWTESGVARIAPDFSLVNVAAVHEISLCLVKNPRECLMLLEGNAADTFKGDLDYEWRVVARKKIQITEGEGL